MTIFYDRCANVDFSSMNRDNAETSHSTLPCEFNVEEQWSSVAKYLEALHLGYITKAKSWCYNMRGHIAHRALTGREAGYIYDLEDHGFRKLPAGNSTESVKRELMSNAPVLSPSFWPTRALRREHGLGDGAGGAVIFGWRLRNGVGEVWLVRVEGKTLEVLGTSSLLCDDAQIPAEDVRNWPWHNPTLFPYIERDFLGRVEWLTYTVCDLNFTSEQVVQLQALLGGEELCAGQVVGEKRQIEVYNKGMKAMSRRAEITELVLKWDKPGAVTLRINFL
jgi:hypothetical protein